MLKSLIDYYDKILEKLENANWATKEMTFHLLGIDNKETMEKLVLLSENELKKVLKLNSKEIIKILN